MSRLSIATWRGASPCYAAKVLRRLAFGVLAVAGGCGEGATELAGSDPPPPVAWNAVCGTDGPHRVLPLAEGEHAYRVERSVDGERVLVSAFLVDPDVPLGSGPPTLDRVIHSVGPCGEGPVEVARGLSTAGSVGAVMLACGEDGYGAWAIDPSGGVAPRQLLEGWCPVRTTDAGLLTVQAPPEATHGSLVVLEDASDPGATPRVLAERIRVARNAYFGPGGSGSTSLWASGGEAIVLDEGGIVWHVDLLTGERTEELPGVRELRASSDGRVIIWQALEPSEGEADTPVGPVFLREREAGTDAHLLNTHLEWTGTPYVGDYLMIRDDADGVRLWWREGLEPIERPAGTEIRGLLDGGELWLARRVDGITEELRWHPADGGEGLVFARHDGTVARRGDGIEIFETDDVAAPSEGSLSFVPLSGGEPVVLAPRVNQRYGRLEDGRVLSTVGVDETDHGVLWLVDPEDGSIVGLDFEAYVQSPRLTAGGAFEGEVVFATAGEERPRGVYRGRVAE